MFIIMQDSEIAVALTAASAHAWSVSCVRFLSVCHGRMKSAASAAGAVREALCKMAELATHLHSYIRSSLSLL